MFARIKAWLLTRPQTKTGERAFPEHEIATAALLVEAAAMDGLFDVAERGIILKLLARRFSLSQEDAAGLLAVGEARQKKSNEVFKFALAVREAFSEAERVGLMEMLWTIVLSDGVVHDYEGSLMRRLVGLLHVPDIEAGEARKRAEQQLRSSQGDEA